MTDSMVEPGRGSSGELLQSGREALGQGSWVEARTCFEAAIQQEESAEALESLGVAAWWLEDTPATIDARRRAYRLYRGRGDAAGAARSATGLAMDFFLEGDQAVARGWMQRARRLLEGDEASTELGWLAIFEAHMALFVDHDPAAAESFSGRAAGLGASLGDVDLEMLGLAYQGFAMVSRGGVEEGMRLLDEATTAAMAGEMTDIDATATACCCLIYACERVRDFGRAGEWCERLKEFCERWSYQLVFSTCRAHYAGVLMWRGAWDEAESALQLSIGAFEATRPAQAAEALVRLAELRCRQGRLDEAETLLERAESGPTRMMGHTLTPIVRAELALARGGAEDALDWAERFLAGISADSWMERPTGMEVLVRAQVASARPGEARETAAELRALAERIATDPLLAAARYAQGLVAGASGEHTSAREHLEAALRLYERSGAPFEAARCRTELARVLLALGRTRAGQREAGKAVETLGVLGAPIEAERAQAVADTKAAVASPPASAGLTAREVEVVRLAAQGLGNDEIAARLYLSVRTVERHLSNVYVKIGAGGKSARAAASVYAAKNGLV